MADRVGNIQRLTYAKSHSKQVYHDARKSAWGDLFPHEPKTNVVRKRGVRQLVKEEGFAEAAMMGDELDVEMDGLEMEGMPVAQLDIGDGDEVITYKSGRTASQRREHSTSTRPSVSTTRTASQQRYMSARPESQPNHVPGPRPKVTLNTLRSLAASKTPITCLTAYDFPTALLSESAGIDMVLVGDSLSQVALGHSSTTQITLDEMIHHAKAVTRGAKTPFVFADLPFGSFEQSLEVGVTNVIRMIKESGVDGVKIEGGREIVPLVKRLSSIGIPIIPHIGLQPQRATSLSGYLVQGKTAQAAMELFETAKELHEAGATGFLLEAIPHRLATYISDQLQTITIGIGAGSGTHAQVLVITDVLGLYETEGPKPRFVRSFGNVGEEMRKAVEGYRDEVKVGGFPEMGKETYGMKKEEWEGFLKARGEIGV
jgi:3-methyl-2-oxobutanoate hydroxymethyltransferase